MATLSLTALTCLRQQDVTGLDEWEVWVDGKLVLNGSIDKGETKNLAPKTVPVGTTTKVAVKEANKNNSKQIGNTITLDVAHPAPQPLDFKTSGAHYELFCSLSA